MSVLNWWTIIITCLVLKTADFSAVMGLLEKPMINSATLQNLHLPPEEPKRTFQLYPTLQQFECFFWTIDNVFFGTLHKLHHLDD